MPRSLLAALLLVSCAHPQVPGRARRGPDPLLYTVQFGDTLTGIARRFDVKGGYPELATVNDLWDPDWIIGGQHLKIPPTAKARATLSSWPTSTPFTGSIEACGVETLPAPRTASVSGCAAAACVTVDGQTHICSCDSGEQGADGFRLTHTGSEPVRWPVDLPTTPARDEWMTQGGTLDFDVSRLDIDRDGDTELVVAHLRDRDDTGRSFWNVAIIDDVAAPVAPLTMTLGNYGPGTFAGNDRGSCDVLATEWELHTPMTAVSDRWYLVGRRFRYTDGALRPTSDEVLARRLLYAFDPAAVVSGHPSASPLILGSPARDLGTTATERRTAEPLTSYERFDLRYGKVTAALSADAAGAGPTLTLALGDDTITMRSQPNQSGNWDGYQRLGDRETGRLYPLGYSPAGGVQSLVGQRVTAVTYFVSDWDTPRILWLDG